MTITRVYRRGLVPVLAVVVAGVVAYRRLCRRVAACHDRVDEVGRDVTAHLDEVCVRVHDLGQCLGVYPDPTAIRATLATEATEAEDRADREDRREVDPMPGQRARQHP